MSRAHSYSHTELILQPFRHFTYVVAHYLTLPSLYIRHSSFSNPSVASPSSPNPSVALHSSQLILQPFRRFTFVTAHSPTLPSLYLRHSSFTNPSVALHTSQLILQPIFRSSYVTSSALTVIHLASRPCPLLVIFFLGNFH